MRFFLDDLNQIFSAVFFKKKTDIIVLSKLLNYNFVPLSKLVAPLFSPTSTPDLMHGFNTP